MPRVIWNDVVLAESDRCETVEGNYYFPPDSVKKEYFTPSRTHTICFWKGQATYFNLEVNGETFPDGAWTYPDPKEKAKNIKDYVAFYRRNNLKVED